MQHWNALDSCTIVGRHLRYQAGQLESTADLLDEMDHYSVAEALVLDCLSRECHPDEGNRRVLQQVEGHPRLHPAWSALPHAGSDEQLPPEEFLAQMRAQRVAALFLFPAQYKFTLDDWCVDPFLEPFARERVPVFINSNDIGPSGSSMDATNWSQVVALCRRWPTLPVIVSEFRIRRSMRMVYRALEACPNLHIELSGYWLHRGIEYISSRFGAHRLIYGSNWPAFGPHMTLATLTTADISDADKRLIAGDNMRQLMSWHQPEHPQVQPTPPPDEFVAFGRSGQRPASMLFHDNHGHLGGRSSHYHVPGGDLDTIVADMDRLGIKTTCVFSFTGVFSDETRGNDIVADACRRFPHKFVGFTLVNPHRGRQLMLDELARGHDMGLRGVKLIPTYQGYPEEGPNIDVACEWAHEHRQIILNHYWGGPKQMERLVSTYTNACFFTGHTTTEYAQIMKRHANLFVCSCPLIPPRACEDVVAAIGADRFMFGSDLQDLPIAWGLGPILFARITPAEKRLILGENLQRVLLQYSRPHEAGRSANQAMSASGA